MSYEEFVKSDHNRELAEYIQRAPQVAQAVQGMDISDFTWKGYKVAKAAHVDKVFLLGLSDAERQSLNRALSYAAGAKLKYAGKAMNTMESSNIDERLMGAGSFSDFKQIFQEDYNAKAATYNTLIGAVNNDGLVEMYRMADKRGLPVWAQPWDGIAPKTGKKR